MPRRDIHKNKCNQEINLKYILKQENGKRVNKVRKTDYFDSDLIEDTTFVKRLPRSYIIKSFALDDIPFDKTTTKIRRYTLPHPEYLSGFVYHVQDQVEFYEVITYSTEESFPETYIQPPFLPILRVRAVNKVIRRPVYYRRPEDITELDVPLPHDPLFFQFWIDQHKRDVLKYQEGNGIRLIKVSPDQARVQYWNQQVILSKQIKFIDNTASRIKQANYLSLITFGGDTCEFYQHSTAQPHTESDDNLGPVVQEFHHVRSVVNGLPETLVYYRAPNLYHLSNSSYQVRHNNIYNLHGATIVKYGVRLWLSSRTENHRFEIHGYQVGANTHFDAADYIW
jgi:hypothetical protein